MSPPIASLHLPFEHHSLRNCSRSLSLVSLASWALLNYQFVDQESHAAKRVEKLRSVNWLLCYPKLRFLMCLLFGFMLICMNEEWKFGRRTNTKWRIIAPVNWLKFFFFIRMTFELDQIDRICWRTNLIPPSNNTRVIVRLRNGICSALSELRIHKKSSEFKWMLTFFCIHCFNCIVSNFSLISGINGCNYVVIFTVHFCRDPSQSNLSNKPRTFALVDERMLALTLIPVFKFTSNQC